MPCCDKCGIGPLVYQVLEGIIRADHSEVAYTTADGNDYPAHEQTYEGFLKLTKYGTIAVIAIVALMAIFLT